MPEPQRGTKNTKHKAEALEDTLDGEMAAFATVSFVPFCG